METLKKLTNPVDSTKFVNEYWDRTFLYVSRDNPTYFRSIFSIGELDRILARNDLRFPAIKVFMNGEQIPFSSYSTTWHYGRERYDDLINTNRVIDLFDSGATLNVLSLERLSYGVAEINHGLESDSGFPVHTTAFLTPCTADNIPPHFDMVDFFVLQIFGTKRWRLWQTATGLPLVEDRDRTYKKGDSAISEEKALFDVCLKPGDTLFVPRGMIHSATTSTEPSLHVTVGVNPFRRWDTIQAMLGEAVSILKTKVEARRALPLPIQRSSVAQIDEYRNRLRNLAGSIFENVEETMIRARRKQTSDFVSSRYPSRSGQLATRTRVQKIQRSDKFRRRKNVAAKYEFSEDNIRLEFHNKVLTMNRSLAPIIELLFQRDVLNLDDLPGDISDAGKSSVIFRLVREGFVEVLANNDNLFKSKTVRSTMRINEKRLGGCLTH